MAPTPAPVSPNLAALKALAEKFRKVSHDKAAVTALADDTLKASPAPDLDCCDLCSACKAAKDSAAINALCDGVAARK